MIILKLISKKVKGKNKEKKSSRLKMKYTLRKMIGVMVVQLAESDKCP